MKTSRNNACVRFWMWIGFAFILGVVAGGVLTVGGMIVLQATIDYAQ